MPGDSGGKDLNCVLGLASHCQYVTLVNHPSILPEQGTFFVRQSDKFIGLCICKSVVSAVEISLRYMRQRVHQRDGLANLARILECAFCVGECSVGITEYPQSQ